MHITRCGWANKTELEQRYHDTLWGKPVHDDNELFAMLMLEGMQAGLSWATILAKMDSMRKAFDNFIPEKLIAYDDKKIKELLENKGIIRNKLKINAVIHNAKMYFILCETHGSLDNFLWSYVDHAPIINSWATVEDVPASTPLSDAVSRQLKKEGFKFVGTTTVYAFMQAVGMVNDHLLSCSFRNAR